MNEKESLKFIISQFQHSIERLKELPATPKRLAHISDLESRIAYREEKILELEIEESLWRDKE